ncbi:MAG: hypothetical protein EKK55_17260 [Rhodocyclaceae bacterium]|nr:MAG: hypothetical protein EKK55_17260 [Rhodocyclaceae bacterium]
MKNKPIDQTWHCGCRMFQDGVQMVWNKCPLHEHSLDLVAALSGLLNALTDRMMRTGANHKEEDAFKAAYLAVKRAEGRLP